MYDSDSLQPTYGTWQDGSCSISGAGLVGCAKALQRKVGLVVSLSGGS